MTSTHAKKPGTITMYLGDGINLTIDGSNLSISASRTGERPIELRPAIFKRLVRAGLAHLHNLPDEEYMAPPPIIERTVPLLTVIKSRDEEMAEWELTLRRKREALAKPREAGGTSKPLKPIEELA